MWVVCFNVNLMYGVDIVWEYESIKYQTTDLSLIISDDEDDV